MALTLIIGNKNYSSWSFRAWIAMKVGGIPFDEILIPLYHADSKRRIQEFSPAGKVPVLIDGDKHIWESLAILEYLAEAFPDARLWPADAAARAHARTVSAEMHAGFAALRSHCSTVWWRPVKARELTPQAAADAARIDALWTDCRRRFGGSGPFLFGAFTAADAMFAPVVLRFSIYDIAASETSRAYMAAVMALPAWREWTAAARAEPWVLSHCEVDWPDVPRLPPEAA